MNYSSKLLSPFKVRGLTLRNRIVVPPMAMYSANNGYPTPFHHTHYSKFAMGGAGLVMLEQTAITRNGRISNGDLGLWEDNQINAIAQLVSQMKSYGAATGIQLNHAGRKSSQQRAFRGNGPLTDKDVAAGDEVWQALAPSALPLTDGWQTPKEMTSNDMDGIEEAFILATKRAIAAGFDVIELHMAHGYLLQNFLSPLANIRTDEFGGSLENRMRFPLRVAKSMRLVMPESMPLFVRISASDWMDGGWTQADSIVLSSKLKELGVDVIDCSSGGNMSAGATNSNLVRGPGYQVPFSEEIRAKVDVYTAAVGMIRTPEYAEEILEQGRADLVCIGRQMLFNPFWAHHAAHVLGHNSYYDNWPEQYGWWLEKWESSLKRNQETP